MCFYSIFLLFKINNSRLVLAVISYSEHAVRNHCQYALALTADQHTAI